MDILYELIAKKLQPGYGVNVIKGPVRFPDRLFYCLFSAVPAFNYIYAISRLQFFSN
jgi:hypothetical protein